MDKTTLIDLRQSGLIDDATFDSEIARLARENMASENPQALLRSEIVDKLRELNEKRHAHEGHEGRWYAERRLERQMRGASKIKLEAMLEKAVAENTRLSRLHESVDNGRSGWEGEGSREEREQRGSRSCAATSVIQHHTDVRTYV